MPNLEPDAEVVAVELMLRGGRLLPLELKSEPEPEEGVDRIEGVREKRRGSSITGRRRVGKGESVVGGGVGRRGYLFSFSFSFSSSSSSSS